MEQDVDTGYRTVCTTCLSSDRNLYSINGAALIYQVFRLLMYDFAGDRFGETLDMEQYICWECLALMKRFIRFKQQVHSAQEHLRVLALSQAQESIDHTYISQSLSSLEMSSKTDYDKIYFDYGSSEPTQEQWPQQYITMSSASDVKSEHFDIQSVNANSISLDIDEHMLEVPEIVLENPMTGVMSHIVVGTDAMVAPSEVYTHAVKGESNTHTQYTVKQMTAPKMQYVLEAVKVTSDESKEKKAPSKIEKYITEYMSECEMMATREAAKLKVQYASSVYKCELCIIGFYTQQQVEDHFVSVHRVKPGFLACKVCYSYIAESALSSHVDSHYFRYSCKLCAHVEYSARLIALHVDSHAARPPPRAQYSIGGAGAGAGAGGATHRGGKKKKGQDMPKSPPKPGDLRKLLSKTTIEGYQCLECDMFFKNSRARKNHVARFHREGLQCDHCKKRFVNRTTLATHLRLHEGPLPREECPICHKMVRAIQLKYHIKRHENKSRHVCSDCNKVFSHLATYQAHLKYSRAHASDNVYKFPCPMCNKGYPTKEQMQDHFNYQHLGKTTHKCPVCAKPIASRANVDKHMMRVHGEKKEKPRNHRCQHCGKTFTDKKALTQHEVIHSGERPLTCDICQQTFKQKASLYTHRKRVHKVFPAKRVVEFMDIKVE